MRFTIFLIIMSWASMGISQKVEVITLSKQEQDYQRRIKKAYLNKVYIPKDLGECIVELNKLVSRESKAKFKKMPEAAAKVKLHFSLGRWIWHNWSLYEGSRLSVYFNKMKINHPEDMATFVVIAYHRYLNKKEIKAKELSQELRAARDKERRRLKNKGS